MDLGGPRWASVGLGSRRFPRFPAEIVQIQWKSMEIYKKTKISRCSKNFPEILKFSNLNIFDEIAIPGLKFAFFKYYRGPETPGCRDTGQHGEGVQRCRCAVGYRDAARVLTFIEALGPGPPGATASNAKQASKASKQCKTSKQSKQAKQASEQSKPRKAKILYRGTQHEFTG